MAGIQDVPLRIGLCRSNNNNNNRQLHVVKNKQSLISFVGELFLWKNNDIKLAH